MSNVFASNHPLVAHKLGRLRDRATDPKRFRELVREIAALLAYEATADLATIEGVNALHAARDLRSPRPIRPRTRREGSW